MFSSEPLRVSSFRPDSPRWAATRLWADMVENLIAHHALSRWFVIPKSPGRSDLSGRRTFAVALFMFGGSLFLFGLLLFLEYARTTETIGILWWQELRDVPMSERLPNLHGAIAMWGAAAILGAVAVWLVATTPDAS